VLEVFDEMSQRDKTRKIQQKQQNFQDSVQQKMELLRDRKCTDYREKKQRKERKTNCNKIKRKTNEMSLPYDIMI
jgi:hypothetical protein